MLRLIDDYQIPVYRDAYRYSLSALLAAAWLIFLMETLSDESKLAQVISHLCEETGLSREKVEKMLYVTYQLLTEDLPKH